MKRFILFFVFTLVAVFGFAAINQTGYVKTRGRLNSNGQVIPGKRLSAATVVLQNNSSVVSNHSGDFTLTLPANKYHLKNVKKEGYVVSDPDILSKQYAYSPNPLVLVLDEPSAQQDDKLASERKLRRNLQKQLQQREDELEALKGQNKITQEQYREALQKLYSDQESNEKFIAEMAERYSKIDFDQLDDFQQQITALIQNGELSRADSLLRTKGSMDERENEIKRIIKANNEEEKELARREKILNESKKTVEALLIDFSTDCYNRYELCKLNFDIDSAAYWLEKRAILCPENINFQLEIGSFLRDYMVNYPLALNFLEKALVLAIDQNGENDEYLAVIYNNIGKVYCENGEYKQALINFNKAKDIISRIYGNEDVRLFEIYNNIGYLYYLAGAYYMAYFIFEDGAILKLGKVIKNDPDLAIFYNNAGLVETKLHNPERALECYKECLKIQVAIYGENHPNVAKTYNNIGETYYSMNDHSQALEYFVRALKMQLEIFGENHPDVANSYWNIGKTNFYLLGNFSEAVENLEKALEIRQKIFGEYHPNLEDYYDYLAEINLNLRNYSKMLLFRGKAAKIRKDYYNEIFKNYDRKLEGLF